MDKQFIVDTAVNLVNHSPGNYISAEIAMEPELAGMRMYEEPLVGIAGVSDDLFHTLKASVIGPHFKQPQEWLANAKTVISIFFPLCDTVKKGNKRDLSWPSNEWLLARYEGQAFIAECSNNLKTMIEAEGCTCIVPFLDKRFSAESPFTNDKKQQNYYTSNWSERHVAYVCGLGTFGLSKGLITEKGIAGRFASFIIDTYIEPDARPYTDIYEYCTMCGACARNCPVGAISLEKGKNHPICSDFLDQTREKCTPRYGCGKCQVKVPCENGIPNRQSRSIM